MLDCEYCGFLSKVDCVGVSKIMYLHSAFSSLLSGCSHTLIKCIHVWRSFALATSAHSMRETRQEDYSLRAAKTHLSPTLSPLQTLTKTPVRVQKVVCHVPYITSDWETWLYSRRSGFLDPKWDVYHLQLQVSTAVNHTPSLTHFLSIHTSTSIHTCFVMHLNIYQTSVHSTCALLRKIEFPGEKAEKNIFLNVYIFIYIGFLLSLLFIQMLKF